MIFLRDSGRIARLVDLEYIFTEMGLFMKVIGVIISKTVKVLSNGQIAVDTRVSSKTVKSMDMVLIYGLMGVTTQDIGMRIN